MKTLLLLAAITLAIQAQAGTEDDVWARARARADNGTGKIVVYYSAYNLGLNPVSYVYLDQYEGPQGVALHANRYHEFIVTPGAHRLIRHGMLGSQDAIEVHVKNGETVYVESHGGTGHWVFEVSEDQAHAKLRVSQLKPQN